MIITATLKSTGQKISAELKEIPNIKLVITTEITGYTLQYIYGSMVLKNMVIVVPTYKMDVEKEGKVLASYNVTRDAWYMRGILKEDNNYKYAQVSKRCFEPADGNVNLYATEALSYPPNCGIDAFALRQKGTEILNAEPHIKEIQTTLDGKDIDDNRKDYSKAKGVMIHIAGWFNNGKENKLAGSYGCFGIVPKAQIFLTKKEAEKVKDNGIYKNLEPANQSYKKAINYILKLKEDGKIQVLIKKRTSIEQLKIIKEKK
ncbi:hypothetical protein CAPN006_12270 [Capnocytophaga canimorsus]|uniref:hypothetical protein n=1 Tax=Capnocytophaga canimorsus TaxID=28188 RepID=UPI001AC2D1FC|nr:hypothetical protein [Capnocytophaga canimorsus]GIM56834.1 hypothetical protein CAPN006_12270 [Capnocytophaga canimorsus]